MSHKSKLLIKKKKSKIFYRSIIFKKSCLYNEIFEKTLFKKNSVFFTPKKGGGNYD